MGDAGVGACVDILLHLFYYTSTEAQRRQILDTDLVLICSYVSCTFVEYSSSNILSHNIQTSNLLRIRIQLFIYESIKLDIDFHFLATSLCLLVTCCLRKKVIYCKFLSTLIATDFPRPALVQVTQLLRPAFLQSQSRTGGIRGRTATHRHDERREADPGYKSESNRSLIKGRLRLK